MEYPLIYRSSRDDWERTLLVVVESERKCYTVRMDGKIEQAKVSIDYPGYADHMIREGHWTIVSVDEAISYLEDHNATTEHFVKIDCLSIVGPVEKTPQDIEKVIKDKTHENLSGYLGRERLYVRL